MDGPLEPATLEQFRAWLIACLSGPGSAGAVTTASNAALPSPARQGLLFGATPYSDESPVIRTAAEFEAALDHLEYAVFRRFGNQLTRAERARLDNTIRNALFKAERYVERLEPADQARTAPRVQVLRDRVLSAREELELRQLRARRAELKLAQLANLTPEGFEEFVAELFEVMGHAVETVGGSGDEGADLLLERDGLRAVVQCKYHRGEGVIGSPQLQKFLGTIHHRHCHKGFFVTTRTFSLAAERFAASQPIELIDGPRLVELVHEALGSSPRRDEPAFDFDATPSAT
jgi:restriction system protein